MPYHSSLAIANEFLRRAQLERRSLTHMHLQKYVFLAHGWTLAVSGRPLIEEAFEAWDYGPVVRKLYNALRIYGPGEVIRFIRYGDDTISRQDDAGEAFEILDETESAVIDRVWASYKGFEAFQLSALTHAERSPWDMTFAGGVGRSRFINNDVIGDYFANLAAQHG